MKSGTRVLFDSHGCVLGMPGSIVQQFSFSQTLGSCGGRNNRIAFDHLSGMPESTSQAVLFLLRLIESCLMLVLIIDERIVARACSIDKGLDGSLELTAKDSFFALTPGNVFASPTFCLPKKVVPVTSETMELSSSSAVRFRNKDGSEFDLMFHGDQRPGLHIGDGSVCQKLSPLLADSSPPEPDVPFDVAIMHWGQLEMLQDRHKVDSQAVLESLRGFASSSLSGLGGESILK